MDGISAVQRLVGIIHRLHDGTINFNEAKGQAYKVFRDVETVLDESMFNLAFPVLVEYFFDPAKKVRAILQRKEISRDDLLAGHRFVRKSELTKMMFLSNRYPRSLLVKSAANLLGFMQQNPLPFSFGCFFEGDIG
ncbi:hypothetical protein KJ903_05855 [Patescibacteria group bacterium]|nr:hypothetical protein [Patescibacteria group bacterium]